MRVFSNLDFLRCWIRFQLEKGSPIPKEHNKMLRCILINFFMCAFANYALLNFVRVAAQKQLFGVALHPQSRNGTVESVGSSKSFLYAANSRVAQCSVCVLSVRGLFCFLSVGVGFRLSRSRCCFFRFVWRFWLWCLSLGRGRARCRL